MHDEFCMKNLMVLASIQFENKMYVVHLSIDWRLIMQCDVFTNQSPMCLLCTFFKLLKDPYFEWAYLHHFSTIQCDLSDYGCA
jgi:hypothetical protein